MIFIFRPPSDVLENGRERRDADTTSDEDRHFVAVPVLMALAKRSVQVDLDSWKNISGGIFITFYKVL